jgi:hypothetical protein
MSLNGDVTKWVDKQQENINSSIYGILLYGEELFTKSFNCWVMDTELV